MLVIGDVVGHDTVAAAAMGQLRGLLRGIAFRGGAGPAEVLGDLDRAMQGLTRLRWSSAGHPPPMVRDPAGTVTVLGGERFDLLLGVDPLTRRREEALLLPAGSTVLLYTDGLVEGRDVSLDDGMDLLRALFARLGDRPLEEMCGGLLEQLRPGASDDDVALVAIRLDGQRRGSRAQTLFVVSSRCQPWASDISAIRYRPRPPWLGSRPTAGSGGRVGASSQTSTSQARAVRWTRARTPPPPCRSALEAISSKASTTASSSSPATGSSGGAAAARPARSWARALGSWETCENSHCHPASAGGGAEEGHRSRAGSPPVTVPPGVLCPCVT
jgi:hypothetical protein